MPELTEELDQSAPTPDGTSAEAPANTGSADFETFKSEISKMFDTRFSGFQGIVDKALATRDKRLETLGATLEQLKRSGLSETEREQLEEQSAQQQLAALRAENELLKLRDEFGSDTVSTFQKLLQAETAREQLEIMRSLSTPSEPPTTTPEAESTNNSGSPSDTQPIDTNLPPADDPVDGSDWEAQFEKNPSLADKILKGKWGR